MNSSKEGYRFFSYALVHADYLHLFVNMYVLYTFGELVETYYMLAFGSKGRFFFFLLYWGAAFTSVIPGFEKNRRNPGYSAVGASGAVSAIVFAAILFRPDMKMGLLFLPIMLPAWIFGLLYLTYSYYMAQKGNSLIGHDAHFFGALFGIFFTILLNYKIGIAFINTITGGALN